MAHEIDKYMGVKEAAKRYNVNINTLKERLKGRTSASHKHLDYLLNNGLLKYSKDEDDMNGTWIISTDAMEYWEKMLGK